MSADGSKPIAPVETGTDRLLLRVMRETDRAAFVRYHTESHEHLLPWSPRIEDGATTEQLFEQHLERSERGLRDGTALRLIALGRESEGASVIAGRFNLNNIVRGIFQCADAGWQVGAPLVGRGYATEGVRALLDIAFGTPPRGLGLHRVQASVIPRNAPSLRVAEKCGFRREGLGVKMLLINGRWEDHVLHAKLAEEQAAPDV